MTKIVVYTCIMGSYEVLYPQIIPEGVDLLCFTDEPDVLSLPESVSRPFYGPAGGFSGWEPTRQDKPCKNWDIIKVSSRADHPRLSAKWYRTHPHEFLDKYDISVYIDGNFQLYDGALERIIFALGNNDIAIHEHDNRDCIFDEAEFCYQWPKYKWQPLKEQIENYRKVDNWQSHMGLYCTGMLARHHNRFKMTRLGEDWWIENVVWSYQDQLSIPVIFNRLQIKPKIFPWGAIVNDYFKIHQHARPD